jgi:hypothetical protein
VAGAGVSSATREMDGGRPWWDRVGRMVEKEIKRCWRAGAGNASSREGRPWERLSACCNGAEEGAGRPGDDGHGQRAERVRAVVLVLAA